MDNIKIAKMILKNYVDIFVDDKMRFVFVFSKADHDRLKLLWKNSSIEKEKVKNHGG